MTDRNRESDRISSVLQNHDRIRLSWEDDGSSYYALMVNAQGATNHHELIGNTVQDVQTDINSFN